MQRNQRQPGQVADDGDPVGALPQPSGSAPGDTGGEEGESVDERPATYRDIFAVREYRHLFPANVLSVLGDQLAKVALTFLVFDRTGSEALAATAFASSFLPWIIGGPLLSTFADRLPRRSVLIACDLARASLVLVLVIPGMPVGAMIALLYVANLFAPPFSTARAAMMPEVMEGDRYVVANGLDQMTAQLGQVIGFAVGGAAVALLTPRGALLADVATFLVSAVLITVGVRHRPAAKQSDNLPGVGGLLRDSWSGAGYVFGNPTLRAYLLLFWFASMFAYAAEGLAAPLAEQLGGGAATGGLLLAAAPLGTIVGTLIIGRYTPPALRIRLLLPLAVFGCAILIPIALAPPLPVLLALLFAMGFGTSFSVVLNPLFGRAVVSEYRGRAFGVASTGSQVTLGLGILLAGVAAESALAATSVAALSGTLGVVVVLFLGRTWPHRTFRERRASTATSSDPSTEAAA